MTRYEIIQNIIKQLKLSDHQFPPSLTLDINNTTMSQLIMVINDINSYLHYHHKEPYHLINEIITIMEQHHKLSFESKVDNIINENS